MLRDSAVTLKESGVIKPYVEGLNPRILGLAERPKVKVVSPLELGEANLNFLVRANGKSFVFRINMDPTSRGKSRREFETLNLLSGYRISPKAFHLDESKKVFDEPILIIEYIEGLPLSVLETHSISTDSATKLAELVASVHSLNLGKNQNTLSKRGVSYASWVNRNRRNIEYIRSRRTKRIGGGDSLDRLLDDGFSKIRLVVRQAKSSNIAAPAHGDVCAQNVIVATSNGRLRLIDWENFGMWDPAAEIALIFEGFGLDFLPRQMEQFLHRYGSLRHDETLRDRIDTFRPLVRFEQLTWGIKHVVEIEVGDMDRAFIERTSIQKHLDFVNSCLQRCSESHLINISPEKASEFKLLPPKPR